MLDQNIPHIRFLGVEMHAISMRETVAQILKRLNQQQFTQHVVVNVAKLVHMKKDAQLRDSVTACDLVNIDGMGVVWGARLCGLAVPERVAGVDLFLNLIAAAAENDLPVFFLGAKEDVVAEVAERLQKKHPGLRIAGYHHGYFWDDEEAVVNSIRESGAKLLFVAITSPRKENFINRWQQQLGVSFVMGVGGTFDVVAGQVKRAPQWVQQVGMEWFYRVCQEPRRMWKRYLVTNTKYAVYLLAEIIRHRLLGAKRTS